MTMHSKAIASCIRNRMSSGSSKAFGLALFLLLPAVTSLSGLSPASATPFTVSVFENGVNVGPTSGEGTFSSSTPLSATMTAGPVGGNITATAESKAGHVGTLLKETESLGGQGFAIATFSTQVTISGPAATTIPIALNLNIAGIQSVSGSAATGWSASAEIAATGFAYSTTIDTGSSPTIFPNGLVFTQGGQTFSALSDSVSGVLTTGFVNVDPSLPLNISFSLELQGFGNPGSVDDNFLSSLDFARGIDVFTLPPGYTVNDADAFLIDNRFLPPLATPIPEPAALPLFVTGLAGLGLLGRRKKRSAKAVTS